jgi:hypothetical protein
MAGTTFQQLIQLYRAVDFDQGSMEGYVRIVTQDQVSLLTGLLSEESASDTSIALLEGDVDQLSVGQRLRIRIGQPRIGLGLLVQNIQGLLDAGHVAEPKRYFIVDSKFAKDDANPPADIVTFRNVLAFVALLKEASAYLDSTTEELIFIHGGRFAVPVDYRVGDLRGLDAKGLGELVAKFAVDTHREQKLSILASTVYDMTVMAKPERRFSLLLTSIVELSKRFSDGYRLFCSDFSYDKIKSSIQDAKIEFTGKIHKTVTDIQNQVLAIPVATIIIATQMKHAITFDTQFWINTGVLIGCWIFLVLTLLLLRNQSRTLRVISQEVDRQERKIAGDHKLVADMFLGDFDDIRERVQSQQSVLWIIAVIVVIGWLATHVVYAELWELRH